MGVYELLRRHGEGPGPWSGDAIAIADSEVPVDVTDPGDLLHRPPRRRFERVNEGRGFLQVRATEVSERDADGNILGTRPLEYVVPAPLSSRTISTALLRRDDGRALLGVDDDDLPAAQCIGGHSSILVTPAWRLPRTITTMTPARDWVATRLRAEYGLTLGRAWELGGRYHPSPGSTPEVVHPIAWEVLAEGQTDTLALRTLTWVPLVELLQHAPLLVDGHLRVAAFRAAHALSLLDVWEDRP